MKVKPYFFPKQQLVVDWWFDHTSSEVSEVLYGGAAGGGKTRVGVSVILASAILYEGSRWVIGRSRLKVLRETTLVTLLEVCKDWGLKRDVHFKLNEKDNDITILSNGSRILLKDLFAYPSDPNFDSLGSLEVCGGFVDEVPQVQNRVIGVLSSRLRYNLKKWCECGALNDNNEVVQVDNNGEPIKWRCKSCKKDNEGLRPKLLLSCNPSRGWVYSEFYDKWRKGKLPEHRRFIPSLVTDNPKISPHYITQLQRLPKLDRERLLNGNWEYSDMTALFDVVKIQTFLSGNNTKESEGINVMAVDPARLGKDSTVAIVMTSDKQIICVKEWQGLRTNETAKKLGKLASKYDVDEYDIAIDTDGVGGGVADHFDEVTEVVNNARALNGENYDNLKTQLYYKLAEEINNGSLTIAKGVITDEQAERITEELEVVKREKVDQDGRLAITKKKEIKQALRRSPDYADCLAYLMYFIVDERLDDELISL